MKTKLLYSALIASCLVALSSCDPNDWNDKLDGFDGDKGITNKQMIAYTFTDADYTNLAANSANIKQAGDTLSKELKAVGTQHYFTNKITARDYIPNFLSDSDFAYFTLSDGSSINITYRVAGNVPEEVTNFGAASYKYLAIFLICNTDGDTGIHISCKINISNGSSVNATFIIFQFPNQLAGTDFWRTG